MNFANINNIEALLNNAAADDDEDESALESELEAILAGKDVKRVRGDNRPNPSKPLRKAPIRNERRPQIASDFNFDFNVSQKIESESDDGSDLERDPHLLAELENIVGAQPVRKAPAIPNATLDSVPRKANTSGTSSSSSVSVPSKSQVPFDVSISKTADSTAVTKPESDFSQVKLDQSDAEKFFHAPPPPTTVLEALEQRLGKYKQTLDESIAKNETLKINRIKRIVKKYEQAITNHKAGKYVDYESLPTPPGFADIPLPSKTAAASLPSQKPIPKSNNSNSTPEAPPAVPPRTTSQVKPLMPEPTLQTNAKQQSEVDRQLNDLIKRQQLFKEAARDSLKKQDKMKAMEYLKNAKGFDPLIEALRKGQPVDLTLIPTPPQMLSVRGAKKASTENVKSEKQNFRESVKRQSSIADKQLGFLLERQRLFKEAARDALKREEKQQALEYLKMAKGFEPLIEATKSGLPIDATSIPTPPQISDDFVVVSKIESSTEECDFEKEEMFRKLEIELQKQIQMCQKNKDHFMKLGDVSSAAKFEKYAIDSNKDLDMLRSHWKNGDKVPRFAYETRTFSIVVSNADMSNSEVIVEVVKAIDVPGKDEMNIYLKIKFPFPTDAPQFAKTRTIKSSLNSEFNESFKFDIDRKSRSLPRVFKRHPLELVLYSKGGFLRSDVLIGTAYVKLTDFETKCTIHDSFPLMEGRKTVGGKIEAKIMIREPLLAKQVEEIKEKWLVFG